MLFCFIINATPASLFILALLYWTLPCEKFLFSNLISAIILLPNLTVFISEELKFRFRAQNLLKENSWRPT